MNLFFNHPPHPKIKLPQYFHGFIFVGHKIAIGCLGVCVGISGHADVKLRKKINLQRKKQIDPFWGLMLYMREEEFVFLCVMSF